MKINKYHGFSYEIIIFKSNNKPGYVGEATLYYPHRKNEVLPVHISNKGESIFPTEEQAKIEIKKSVMNYLDGKEEKTLKIKTPSRLLKL